MTQYLLSILPPKYKKKRGARFQRAFGSVADSLYSDTIFGVKEAMIEECTADAYPAHLRNSSLTVVPGEAPATTLGVLRSRWQQARESGGVDGVTDALERLGCTQVQVVTELDLVLAGVSSPFGSIEGFFFVIVAIPGLSDNAPVWKGGQVWLQNPSLMPPIPPNYWDSDSAAASLLTLAAIHEIQKYKPATTSCRFLVVPRDATFAFNPTGTPPFTGSFVIVPVWELWERNITTNRIPNEFYNLSYLVP